MEDEINNFLFDLNEYSQKIMPSFMRPNSHYVSIQQASPTESNLQISLDFRISNKDISNYEPVPESIKIKKRLEAVHD